MSDCKNNPVRDSNIELLRVVAIFLIILQHSRSGIERTLDHQAFIWLSAISSIGVNVFVLITGYFGARLSIKSITNLFFICFFYSVLKITFGLAVGNVYWPEVFFVSKANWFIPTYLSLLAMTPMINTVNQYTKREFIIILSLVFLSQMWFGFFPKQVDMNIGFNKGYSVLHFILIYLCGRYLRIHVSIGNRSSFFWGLIYAVSCIIIVVACILLLKFNFPKNYIDILFNYNNPIVIISSIAFFCLFTTFNFYSKSINYIAGSVLAVLLLHSSHTFYPYFESYFLSIYAKYNGLLLFLLWILGCVCVFIISVIIDQIRLYFYSKISPGLNNTVSKLINNVLK